MRSFAVRTLLSTALVTGAALHAQPAAHPTLPAAPASWTRGATCYEVFVRSFYDSDGDGVGDLNGLIQKLDYINDGTAASLGARCIWLMPVAMSPSYHGYDVTNYYRVNPDYGTNDDFKRLVAEAHRRGIRILVDMVLNHSSSEHPWFKAATLDPNSPYRSWYTFNPTDPGIRAPWGAQIWHHSPNRDEWYYGLFVAGMPDLNLENPAVVAETERIAEFWLREMGVDGFRLDAVKHFGEEGLGRRVEHVASTHVFLRDYMARLRRISPEVYTVGEVWSGVDDIMPYYPEQLDSYFQFEVADRILNAVRDGRAAGMLDPLMKLQASVPANRYSPFLRNHDMQRPANFYAGDIAKAKLAGALLLTLPGLPFVYYGEELGMNADRPDPRVRTPMQWSRGPSAGFSRGLPWEPLLPDSLTANVEAQAGDAASILNQYRRLIHLRADNPALAEGELVPLTASSPQVVAYLRRAPGRTVLVMANLGTSAVAAPAVTSPPRVIGPGRYTATGLLGGDGGEVTVRRDGSLQGFAPFASLAPLEARVVELTPR